MKNAVRNCLATTGLALLLLSAAACLLQGRFLCLETVFQVFAVSIVIHLGFFALREFESQYALVEILVEMGMMMAVLIPAGFLFGWYASTPVWVLVLLGAGVYGIGGMIGMFRTNRDVSRINAQLKCRRETGWNGF